MKSDLTLNVYGHVHIKDDLNRVLLDMDNAIHPQNISRVIARALSNENNFNIHRIAFGNGGTITDAAYTTTYNSPNDGQPPDVRTWDSRLYNEIYSEIIDEGNVTLNPLLGTDPGSAGPNTGVRPGGGAVPLSDPTSIPHVSGPGVRSSELGLTSEIIITSVLNVEEPTGQAITYIDADGFFVFDEIGLYTSGAPAIDSNGYQDIDVDDKTAEDDSGLIAGTIYDFDVIIDGIGPATTISFTTPVTGGSGIGNEILYGDICEAINTGDVEWNASWGGSSPLPGVGTSISITNNSLLFSSISGAQTYGYLRIVSGTAGSGSSVLITSGTGSPSNDMIAALNPPLGGTLIDAVDGQDAGVQNAPTLPDTERERLLTHLIFKPILKPSDRALTITYTITISVARSEY